MTAPGGQRETLALLVASRDEPGVLYRVCEVIYQHGGNITYIATVRSATTGFPGTAYTSSPWSAAAATSASVIAV